jgi:circadian clock protein KaiC
MESRTQEPSSLAATGVVGLDDVLRGGLPRNRLYLIEGDPGAGKTTLALQFLMEGARRGEPGLYVTLSETKEELLAVAASHGFDLDGIQICELVTMDEAMRGQAENTIFHPAEIELGQTTRSVLAEVERTHPRRLAFDSLSEMRLLAQSPPALPPADPVAQAVLRWPGMHRALPGRPDVGRRRPPRCTASPTG